MFLCRYPRHQCVFTVLSSRSTRIHYAPYHAPHHAYITLQLRPLRLYAVQATITAPMRVNHVNHHPPNELATTRYKYRAALKCSIIRQADVVGRLKLYSCPFYFLLALRSAKRCSGRPSNVCRRFGHMYHYSKVPRHLPHPSPNFYRGSKSAIFGLIAQQRSNLSLCGLETEQDICTIFKLGVRISSDNVSTKFGADQSTRFSNHLC